MVLSVIGHVGALVERGFKETSPLGYVGGREEPLWFANEDRNNLYRIEVAS